MKQFLTWVCCLAGTTQSEKLSENGYVALRAARAAVCAARRARVTEVAVKADATRVSLADYAAQAAAMRELPADAYVIAEECASNATRNVLDAASLTLDISVDELRLLLDERKGNGELWWLDPIDGTEGYLSGASWAVGIAMRDGPAALALPARGVILVADGTLWVANDEGGVNDDIDVHQCTTDVECDTIRWHFSPAGKEVDIFDLPPPDRLCCGSLVKYGEVALGYSNALVQAVPSGTNSAWDHAAGVAVVLAAGGNVTDIEGRPLYFDDSHVVRVAAKAFVASAPGADHERWLELAKKTLPLG